MMEEKPFIPWVRVGTTGAPFEYPWHAGLSSDGRLCFMAEYESSAYLVWDIDAKAIIWSVNRRGSRKDYPNLEDWIVDGHITIRDRAAGGTYRVFGIHENYALETYSDITLALDAEGEELIFLDVASKCELQRLEYEPTTEWEVASFSDDGSTIAVLVTHNITFFRQKSP